MLINIESHNNKVAPIVLADHCFYALSFIPFPFVLVLLFCIIPIANTEPQKFLPTTDCKCVFSSSALPLNWWKKYSVSLWFSSPKRVSRTPTKMVDILVPILWETYNVINSC